MRDLCRWIDPDNDVVLGGKYVTNNGIKDTSAYGSTYAYSTGGTSPAASNVYLTAFSPDAKGIMGFSCCNTNLNAYGPAQGVTGTTNGPTLKRYSIQCEYEDHMSTASSHACALTQTFSRPPQ